MDEKYEFNAPKYFDFEHPDDSGDCDLWFDQRSGDEGGVSIDMVPMFENVGSFDIATNAISGALEFEKENNKPKDNKIPDEYIPDTEGPDEKVQEKLNVTIEQIKSNVENNKTLPKAQTNITIVHTPDNCSKSPDNIPDEKLGIGVGRTSNEHKNNVCNETTILYTTNNNTRGNESTVLYARDDRLRSQSDSTEEMEDNTRDDRLRSQSDSSEEMEDNRLQEKADRVKFKTLPDNGAKYKMPTRGTIRAKNNTPKTPKTPKSRFQPVRKTTARPVDYAEKKRKYTPRKFVLDEPEYKKARRTEEERGLDKMKKLQEKTKRHRLINERNMAKALRGHNFEPMRSVSVTQTKEFDFMMSNRTKEHNMLTRSNTPFEKKLRQESFVNTYKNEPTQPVPFNFVLPDKIKSSQLSYVSMAEATKNFIIKKSPTRGTKKVDDEEPRSKAITRPHITKPITPKLLTRKRTRAPHVESAKEIEDRLVEEMKSYQFKATEMNPKVLEMKGMYGVKAVQPVSGTEQDPFNFRIEQRISQRKAPDADNRSEEVNDETKKTAKLKPTIPVPFSFEERDKDRLEKKEKKKQQQEEEERKAREFRARLLPSFSPHNLPDVQAKEPTEVVPFKVSERSEMYQQKYEQKLQVEEEEENKKRQFRATKCDVTAREPFQPLKGLIPPTNVDSNFKLHTEDRAQKRSEFDEWIIQKEKEKEEAKAIIEKQRQLEEEKEIKQLRKDIVHKANPIRNFKPVELKKSSAVLTEPMTPNLRVKARAHVRENK